MSSVMKSLLKTAIALMVLAVASSVAAHGTGRQCSNPYCMMCARLHLIHGHDVEYGTLMATKGWSQLHTDMHAPDTFVPTPMLVVRTMVELAKLEKTDLVYDVGCGDARILIEAKEQHGCLGVGMEINPRTARMAKKNIKDHKLTGILIINDDCRKYRFDAADVIFVYLDTELMEELKDKLLTAKKAVISYSHPIPGVENERILIDDKYPVFIWRRPVEPRWW